MKIEHAQIIAELFANAGYADDADELLGDRLDHLGEEKTLAFADSLDELIQLVNEAVPEDERFTGRTMRQEVERLIKRQS